MKLLDQIATVWRARFTRERYELRRQLKGVSQNLDAVAAAAVIEARRLESTLADVREHLTRREVELRIANDDLIVCNREIENLVAVNTRDLQRVKAEMAAYSGQVADHTGEGRVRIAETREAV